ncbi:MAG: M13 family metallopeptidase [Telluria sp.]
MNKYLLSALTLALIANVAPAADAAKSSAAKPMAKAAAKAAVSGIDTQFIDPDVRAQDDFFKHLNGKWLKNTEIPADKSSWGSFYMLYEDTQPKLREIIETAAKGTHAAGSDQQKIGDFYAAYLDEKRADDLGITPLKGELDAIAALKDKSQLPAYMAHASRFGIATPIDIGVHQDNKDSTHYEADLGQSGLGLPDRDYYLKADDAKLAAARAAYQVHVEKMLALAGGTNAAADAKAIVDFETELAKVQWSRVENRDPIKTYNKVDIAKLAELAPGFDWTTYLNEVGVGGHATFVNVSQPSYAKAMADVLAKAPLETLKAYFTWHAISSYAGYLSKPFVDQQFAFYSGTLQGIKEQRPRWKRGVSATEGALGEVIGKVYVEKYFPASSKARMDELVKNLLAAYKQSIDTLDWMSPATKKEAQAKLAKFTPKIGYPTKWKDYSGLVVAKDDLVGNVMRSRQLEHNRAVGKLGKPIDRTEWLMTPQTINAYYNPEMNEIVFPAAILQPPFFDAKADDAVNYGAIGAVIGHEISHGFDDQGSQYDGDGNLRDWWTAEDHKNFSAKTNMLVEQYNGYAPLPGYNVNGKLTLGENIADNSGLAIAYKAYKISLKGKKAPVIDGMTGEQRFYAGFGQVWRSKMRDEAQVVQVKTDPHSPGQFRANGTVKNQPGFYEAFGVKPGDKMYLAPKDRVIIW